MYFITQLIRATLSLHVPIIYGLKYFGAVCAHDMYAMTHQAHGGWAPPSRFPMLGEGLEMERGSTTGSVRRMCVVHLQKGTHHLSLHAHRLPPPGRWRAGRQQAIRVPPLATSRTRPTVPYARALSFSRVVYCYVRTSFVQQRHAVLY